jgi:WD40 repeat protein
MDNGELLRVLSATEPVFCVRLDGDLIVCGGEKAIRKPIVVLHLVFVFSIHAQYCTDVWSRSKYRLAKTFSAHSKPTTNIAMIGPYAITSSNDRSVKIWQKLSWNCVRMLEYNNEVTAMDVAGDFLFCGDSSGAITIRSVTSGALVPWNESYESKRSSVLALVCLKEARLFVCCSVSGEIQVFETS